MPLVSAFSISRRLSSSGRLQGWLPRPGSPKLIIPRQMRLTSRPVVPRRVYSMASTLVRGPVACHRWQAGRVPAAYSERLPEPALRDVARCVWVTRGGLGPVVPDGCTDILWDGVRLSVAGPDTHWWLPTAPASGRVVGVRLRPGC